MNAAGELEIVNLMPPRIPVATVQAIRQYIANPPDYGKLAAGERVIERAVTEIELQRMRLATAEAQTAAATAQATVIDRQRELTAMRRLAQTTAPQTPDRSVAIQQAASEKRAVDDDIAQAMQEQETIAALAAKAEAGVAAMKAEEDRLLATQPPEDAAAGKRAVPASDGNSDRVERFKLLFPASGIAPEKLKAAMAQHGANGFTGLSAEHQDALLAALQKAADAKAAQPKN
jgi:hypothetical protein